MGSHCRGYFRSQLATSLNASAIEVELISGLLILLLRFGLVVAFVSCGLVPLGAFQASAEEHIVVILEAAYFPRNTTVEPGDVVRFVNESGREHEIFHVNGQWATAPIAEGEELLVTIDEGMTGPFYGVTLQRIEGRLDLLRPSVTD